MSINNESNHRPIVLLTVFKSGTHLMRKVITEITGLPFYEPPIIPGHVNYEDPNQLHFVDGRFYSWHLFPTPPAVKRIQSSQARCVIVVRNVFDLCVSMYHHFAQNIDADIGRGRNVDHLFANISRDEGLQKIICGWHHEKFHWGGLKYHLRHINLLLDLAEQHSCYLTTHEKLVAEKETETRRLAKYLGYSLSSQRIDEIVQATSFRSMKQAAIQRGQGSHYRRGVTGSHKDELTAEHIKTIKNELHLFGDDLGTKCSRAQISNILQTKTARI